MTEADALARLKVMLDYSAQPTLSELEVGYLLIMCKLADSAGRMPSDAAWVPTWDLNRGAAEGWRWKASKAAAAMYDFSADGASYSRSQIAEHCRQQALAYQRKIVAAMQVPSSLTAAGL